jgi:hypothetical protein
MGISDSFPDRKPNSTTNPVIYQSSFTGNANQQIVIQAFHNFVEFPLYAGTLSTLLAAALAYFNGVKAATITAKPIDENQWRGHGYRSGDDTTGREILSRFLSKPIDPQNPTGTTSSTYNELLKYINHIKAKWLIP